MEDNKGQSKQPGASRLLFRGPNLWLLVLALLIVGAILLYSQTPRQSDIQLWFFEHQIEAKNIQHVQFRDREATGFFKEPHEKPTLSTRSIALIQFIIYLLNFYLQRRKLRLRSSSVLCKLMCRFCELFVGGMDCVRCFLMARNEATISNRQNDRSDR